MATRCVVHEAQPAGICWLVARFAPPPWETIVRDIWGVRDEADVKWMVERLVPTPFGHFRDPVRRSNPAAGKLPRTYIRCPLFKSPRFDQHAEMAKKTPGWRFHELASSHHPFVTVPEALVEVLIGSV